MRKTFHQSLLALRVIFIHDLHHTSHYCLRASEDRYRLLSWRPAGTTPVPSRPIIQGKMTASIPLTTDLLRSGLSFSGKPTGHIPSIGRLTTQRGLLPPVQMTPCNRFSLVPFALQYSLINCSNSTLHEDEVVQVDLILVYKCNNTCCVWAVLNSKVNVHRAFEGVRVSNTSTV